MTPEAPPLAADRHPHDLLSGFLGQTRFLDSGLVMTDLDGTLIHEHDGMALLSGPVERGLKQLHDAGHVVVANTLRFPLSVLRVLGPEWQRVTGAPLPLVSLNGSLAGRLVVGGTGRLVFEEWAATVLEPSDIAEILDGVGGMAAEHVDDLLVFFYPRDWTRGEIIWAGNQAAAARARVKYLSASRVFSSDLPGLEAALCAQSLCMVFLLVDAPQERLMAYQHTQRTRFVTRTGVDKAYGARAIAQCLGLRLEDAIGAGDAETDTFLKETGFAVIVGSNELDFKGRSCTVRLPDPAALGELLSFAASRQRG